jgi:hypothetical protein
VLVFGLLAGLIVLGSLVALGMAVVRTWRLVVVFGRTVADAGERVADAAAALEATSEQHDLLRRPGA